MEQTEKRIKAGTYKPRGVRGNGATQTKFNLNLDNDLVEWVRGQVNTTRYINNLIREDKIAQGG